MHPSDDELILHYYGELDTNAGRRVSDHLQICETCYGSFTALQRVLATVEAAPAPEIADGFERIVWARLRPELEKGRGGWLKAVLVSPVRLAWVAGAVLIVMAAFFAGRWQRTPGDQAVVPQLADNARESGLREQVLLADLGAHLDRSQMMLIELVSADGTADLDVATERERAERLAADNRLYRQTAVANGNQALAAVLDDLEQVLVDVAASPDLLTPADLVEVRQRIDSKGLLFKVRVLSSEVQQRQKKEIRARAGQSSS
jgi:hypothetical protein